MITIKVLKVALLLPAVTNHLELCKLTMRKKMSVSAIVAC